MTCAHFELEGLDRLEQGLPDPHVDGCADCQAARATYQKLKAALADVDADVRPKAGWEERVIERVRATQRAAQEQVQAEAKSAPSHGKTARRLRWWLGGAGATALAAAAGVAVLARSSAVVATELLRRPALVATTRATPPKLDVEAYPATLPWARAPRADERWTRADVLEARSRASAVWVYHVVENPGADREAAPNLLVVCDAEHLSAGAAEPTAGAPTCTRSADGVRLLLVTDRPGEYSVFAFDSRPPAPAPLTRDEATALFIGSSRGPRTLSFTVPVY